MPVLGIVGIEGLAVVYSIDPSSIPLVLSSQIGGGCPAELSLTDERDG